MPNDLKDRYRASRKEKRAHLQKVFDGNMGASVVVGVADVLMYCGRRQFVLSAWLAHLVVTVVVDAAELRSLLLARFPPPSLEMAAGAQAHASDCELF